jgi:hypothetical protein
MERRWDSSPVPAKCERNPKDSKAVDRLQIRQILVGFIRRHFVLPSSAHHKCGATPRKSSVVGRLQGSSPRLLLHCQAAFEF